MPVKYYVYWEGEYESDGSGVNEYASAEDAEEFVNLHIKGKKAVHYHMRVFEGRELTLVDEQVVIKKRIAK